MVVDERKYLETAPKESKITINVQYFRGRSVAVESWSQQNEVDSKYRLDIMLGNVFLLPY